MWTRQLNRDDVSYIVGNMRAIEYKEINGYSHENIIQYLLDSDLGWAFGLNNIPIVVIGFKQIDSDSWATYMIATDDFKKIALSIAKLIVRDLIPSLMEVGVRQVYTTSPDRESDSWLSLLGAKRDNCQLWVWS